MKANKVFISLGSNLGKREENLKSALKEIKAFSRIIKKSSIYETEPVGYKKQGLFLNMVIEIETKLELLDLLTKLQEIEHKLGKKKIIKNGPRKIDLDILLYKNEIINKSKLKIPHPRLHKRNFVLTPLAEISPRKIHPKFKKTIKTLLKNLKKPEKVTLWTKKKSKN